MSADQIIDLYQRHALAYDHDRSRSLSEKAWLDRFLGLMPPGASVLDLGCGMGEPIASYLIDQGYSLTGVDSSPTFIDLCQTRFPDHTWLVADMRTMTLPQTYAGLIAWNSFFHLPHADQRHMITVFRRYAAPGAALMFTSGSTYGEAIGSYQDEPLYHASLDTAEYRSLLEEQGFSVVDHILDDPNCGNLTIWLAQLQS